MQNIGLQFPYELATLDNLASNLLDGGKHKFKESLKYGPKENIDLLLKKGVFPYDYMTDWGVFEDTKLPPIEDFYSKLSNSDISEDDYKHAQKVWDTFNIKTLGENQSECYYNNTQIKVPRSLL